MQHFWSQIRLSTKISLALLQDVNLTKSDKRMKVDPEQVSFASSRLLLYSVIYGGPTKLSSKFTRNKIHPTGLRSTFYN